MPKLLDVIKEKGLSHAEVIAMLEKIEIDKPEEESEEQEVPEIEVDATDKPIELYLTEVDTPEEKIESQEEEEKETIVLTQEELNERIEVAIAEKLKSKLKVPSKGKIVTKPQSMIEVIKKNWFEEVV